MKEQIKEIARGICGLNTSDGCFCDGGYCNYNCLAYEKAEALYNAGYRKQCEGEWIINGLANPKCSACNSYNRCGDKSDLCPNCGAKMKGGAE